MSMHFNYSKKILLTVLVGIKVCASPSLMESYEKANTQDCPDRIMLFQTAYYNLQFRNIGYVIQDSIDKVTKKGTCALSSHTFIYNNSTHPPVIITINGHLIGVRAFGSNYLKVDTMVGAHGGNSYFFKRVQKINQDKYTLLPTMVENSCKKGSFRPFFNTDLSGETYIFKELNIDEGIENYKAVSYDALPCNNGSRKYFPVTVHNFDIKKNKFSIMNRFLIDKEKKIKISNKDIIDKIEDIGVYH